MGSMGTPMSSAQRIDKTAIALISQSTSTSTHVATSKRVSGFDAFIEEIYEMTLPAHRLSEANGRVQRNASAIGLFAAPAAAAVEAGPRTGGVEAL